MKLLRSILVLFCVVVSVRWIKRNGKNKRRERSRGCCSKDRVERTTKAFRDRGQGSVLGVCPQREWEGHGFDPHLRSFFQARSRHGFPSLRRCVSSRRIAFLIDHPHLFLHLCELFQSPHRFVSLSETMFFSLRHFYKHLHCMTVTLMLGAS